MRQITHECYALVSLRAFRFLYGIYHNLILYVILAITYSAFLSRMGRTLCNCISLRIIALCYSTRSSASSFLMLRYFRSFVILLTFFQSAVKGNLLWRTMIHSIELVNLTVLPKYFQQLFCPSHMA